MTPHNLPLPLTFRSELLTSITAHLQAGECCSIVGVSGAGKSNLTQFLQREDVQQHYWNNQRMWMIFVDSQQLVHMRKQKRVEAVYELIMHQILKEAERQRVERDVLVSISDMYNDLAQQLQRKKSNPLLGYRYLDRICNLLLHYNATTISIIFDQFEDIWAHLEPQFFINLRALRDLYKYKLVYLVFTRERLERIRRIDQDLESFAELFTAHTYGLNVYSEQDALNMLQRLAQRSNTTHLEDLYPTIMHLTGRHPSTMRAVFWFALNGNNISEPEALLVDTSIAAECEKIWSGLSANEQAITHEIATYRKTAYDHHELTDLLLKKIIINDPPQLFSPLFTSYILHASSNKQKGIIVSPKTHSVWIDGYAVTQNIPHREFNVLVYLARHVGEICSRDRIWQAIYPDENLETDDLRLSNILKRLRAALGENGQQPRYLITHPRSGIQLKEGGITDD